MSSIDPSLLNSIITTTYAYVSDGPGTVSHMKAYVNLQNIETLTVNSLTYCNINFGDASGNLFVGDNSGANSSLMSNVTAVGEESLVNGGSSSNVTAAGYNALADSFGLNNVIALGVNVGETMSNVSDSVFIGDSSVLVLSNSTSNVIIGTDAAQLMTNGDCNVIVGAGAGPSFGSGDNNIAIGAAVNIPSGNNQLNIGNLIYGNFANNTVAIGTSNMDLAELTVSGSINASEGRVRVQTTTSLNAAIALRTNLGNVSTQAFVHYLIDSVSFNGFANQLLAYLNIPAGTSARGTDPLAYQILLSDQALTGLSAGDVNFPYTVQASNVYATNTVSAGTLSATTILGNNISVAGTISATTFEVANLSITGTLSATTIEANNLSVAGTISATTILGNNLSVAGTLSVASAVINQKMILSTVMSPFQQTANGNPYGTATFTFWDPSNLSYAGSTIDTAYLLPGTPYLNFPSTFYLLKNGVYSITLTKTDVFNQPRSITLDSQTAVERFIQSGGTADTAHTVTAWLPAGGGIRVVGDGGTGSILTSGAGVCGMFIRLLYETT